MWLLSAVKAGDNLPVRSDNSPACNDHSRVAQGSTWLTGSLYGGIRSHEASRAYGDGLVGLVDSFSIEATPD
ncbi:hypothetical protein V6N11_035347 [Hibiscus sabdariffa]|uniref:Uncharacterized protein n=1 Tax=Hibiscus sabdariffa TaxID=183260 RepID=A0ABR2R0I1_9ROSI